MVRSVLIGSVIIIAATVVAGAVMAQRALTPARPAPLPAHWTAVVSVLAGDGRFGTDDGAAARARFSDPFGVAAGADGIVYVADAGDAQGIRRITPDGTVTTIAGGTRGYADGSGNSARFDTPSGLAVARDGSLIVADTGNNVVRRVTAAGVVTTIAGATSAGFQDGPAAEARFNGPVGVAVDAAGRIIVADTYNDRIRAIGRDGTVTTIAGSGVRGFMDGAATDAQFDTPCAVAVDRHGNIFVADSGNGAVRRIDPSGAVLTIEPVPEDGLVRPLGIAVSHDDLIYVTDERGRVVEIGPNVSVRVLAGSSAGFANGPGRDARMRGPAGLVLASPGRLVLTDPRNALVRVVSAPERTGLGLPASPFLSPGFDEPRFAIEPLLWPADPMEGPHEITGTMGEARGVGSESAGRFHAGLDVQAFEGAIARAVRDGVVADPVAAAAFGTLNESLRIGEIAYVHIRVGRGQRHEPFDDGRFVVSRDDKGRVNFVRVRRGARFRTGEAIGTVNPFNHVHLNVGWPGEEINPLRFRLVQFEDTVAPTIDHVHLVTLDGMPVVAQRRAPLVVDQPVQVVVDAWDQVDGNEARRRLGLYRLGYQVLHRDGTPVPGFEQPRETIRFDRLEPDPAAATLVYASGSGIPFYGRRSTHFLYVVTNSLRGGHAAAGAWDPRDLPPGEYLIRIVAEDASGNRAEKGRDLPVIVGVTDVSSRVESRLSR
jgi:sugar lactone lactonase YvrE